MSEGNFRYGQIERERRLRDLVWTLVDMNLIAERSQLSGALRTAEVFVAREEAAISAALTSERKGFDRELRRFIADATFSIDRAVEEGDDAAHTATSVLDSIRTFARSFRDTYGIAEEGRDDAED